MTISQIELAEAQYNARDVLATCRVYLPLLEALERNNVTNVYEVDEQMADLAIQMTRAGMPINEEKRAAIGERLRTLRDSAIETLKIYTEGEYREEFTNWAARFMATKARKGEPTNGSLRVGPTRATARLEELRAMRKEWGDFKRKTKALIKVEGEMPQLQIDLAEAEEQLMEIRTCTLEVKQDFINSQTCTDEEDGLVHTAETAFDARVAIRKAQFLARIEKKGVSYSAKIQQCAILRAAGVPLLQVTAKTGLPKIDKEVLESLNRHPASKALLAYILTEKTINMYCEGELRLGRGGNTRPFVVSEDGYAHSLWTIHKITGRWGSSPNCFDGETQLRYHLPGMHPDGKFEKISVLQKMWADGLRFEVAQYDSVTGICTFVRPSVVFQRSHVGLMYHWKSEEVDLCVTGDHRLLIAKQVNSTETCAGVGYTITQIKNAIDITAEGLWQNRTNVNDYSINVNNYNMVQFPMWVGKAASIADMVCTRLDWNGPVYCLTVPSGYVLTYRNKKAVIAGQCQNWSKRAGGGAENLRHMVEAPEGYTFVEADQKQLEARLIGAMSKCEFLLKVFREGRDIHGEMAGVGFPKEWPALADAFKAHKKAPVLFDPEVAPEKRKCSCPMCKMRDKIRDITKRLEYGGFYGGQAKTLWESVVGDFPDFQMTQVFAFMQAFNQRMPEVMVWREMVLREATMQREIRSPILGRRQVFPLGRLDPTVAYNYKAQSGGADLWALGAIDFMKKWDQRGVDARLIHNGHDSVLILCRIELALQVEQDVYACWNREWEGVPFEMEAKISPVWG